MLAHINSDIQVALRPAILPGLSFAAQAHLRAVVYTAGDLYGFLDRLAFQAAAVAGLARRADDLTLAAAIGTGCHLDHVAEKGLAGLAHFAAPVAGGAGALRRPPLCART